MYRSTTTPVPMWLGDEVAARSAVSKLRVKPCGIQVSGLNMPTGRSPAPKMSTPVRPPHITTILVGAGDVGEITIDVFRELLPQRHVSAIPFPDSRDDDDEDSVPAQLAFPQQPRRATGCRLTPHN